MRRSTILTGLGCALLSASPTLAQPEGEQLEEVTGADIVVTGELPTWTEVTRQARDITMPTGLRYMPLPRFEGDRLCPGVIGLKADYAAMMVGRLRANAERFGLWMSEDDGACQANFIVAFVDDGKDILEQISEQWPGLLANVERPDRLALMAQEGLARVWTTTVTRAGGGMPGAEDPATGTKYIATTGSASRLYLPIREDITGVLVLFDRAAVNGKTLVQLSDYATMRGLARTRPVDSDGPVLDTILTLFDPDATPPDELTAFDRAYLGAVYHGMPNLPGLTKVLGVDLQLRRDARKEPAAAGE